MYRRAMGFLAATALLSTGCAVRLVAGRSGTAPSGDPGDTAPRIEVDAAYAKVRAGSAILVDVRGAASYKSRHAQGAMLVPVDDVEQDPKAVIARLPRDKQPILYCT